MSIASDQLKFYKSMYVSDSLTNGGRISAVPITDGALNNLFRNIQSSERDAGITLYRKFFLRNENPQDLPLENPQMWIGNVASGEDYMTLAVGTDTDNQSAADDFTDWYGSGHLNADVVSTDTSLDVMCKDAYGFPSGCPICIKDDLQTVFLILDGAPTWNGSIATLPLTTEIGAEFDKDTAIVSAILNLDDLEPSLSDWLETSSAGTYDETTYPVLLYNIGAIAESWTVTFTSATAFSVSGAVVGSIGSGTIGANFAPVNGAGYYFTLLSAGWGGTWASGDTITFKTRHAAQGLWMKEYVPAGASSQSNNRIVLNFIGESA